MQTGSFLHRLTAQAPALPAPTMSSGGRFSSLWARTPRTVLMSRHKKRTPAMAAVLNTAPSAITAPLMGGCWR